MLSAASRVAAIERPRGEPSGDRERRRVVVGVGWGRSGVARALGPLGGAGGVRLAAFGGDAGGAVLGADAAAFGHHRGARAAGVGWWVGFGCRDPAGGPGRHRSSESLSATCARGTAKCPARVKCIGPVHLTDTLN